jgi:hypothetical protein
VIDGYRLVRQRAPGLDQADGRRRRRGRVGHEGVRHRHEDHGPAQLGALGTFKFGRGALAFQPATRGFEAGAAGAFKLFTATGKAATITLPVNGYRQVAVSKIDKTQAVVPLHRVSIGERMEKRGPTSEEELRRRVPRL